MTYALMIWTIVACGSYSCERDWRQVMTFERTDASKELCEQAAQDLFKDRRYKCVRTK